MNPHELSYVRARLAAHWMGDDASNLTPTFLISIHPARVVGNPSI